MDWRRLRLVQTVILVLTWVNMGLNMNMLYAVLPDILTRTNSTVEDMSKAFSIGNVGGLFVPFFAIFADKLVAYEEAIMGLFLLVCGVAVGLRGFATHVWQHAISSMLEAFFWGGINAVGQCCLLREWGTESGPAMQAIHMGFPIGAILAPFIAVPFVSDSEEEEPDVNATRGFGAEDYCYNDVALRYRTAALNVKNIASLREYSSSYLEPNNDYIHTATEGFEVLDEVDNAETYEYADDSSIQIALGICALYSFTMGLIHLFLQFYLSKHKTKPDEKTIETKNPNPPEVQVPKPKQTLREIISFDNWAYGHGKFGSGVMLLTCLFYVCHVAATIGIMTYLVTYATDSDLGFSNEEAAWMQMTVSIAAAFGRGICIYISKKLPLNVMLAIELHGQVIMGVIMLIWGSQSYVGLWVTSCVYVLFREPTWPSGMTWPSNFIVMLVFLMAILQISISICAIPFQLWQGYLYTNKSPDTIFYTTIVFGFLNCIVYYFMLYMGRIAPIKNGVETQPEKNESLYTEKKVVTKSEYKYFTETPAKPVNTYTNTNFEHESHDKLSVISSSTYL